MKCSHSLLWALLLLPVAGAAARGFAGCEVHSDYGLRLGTDVLSFDRQQGAPREVRIAGGRLWIDGHELTLSAADRRRIEQIEQGVRALVPEVKAIALDAVGLAATAMGRVAETLGGRDGSAVAERIRALQSSIGARIDEGLARGQWDDRVFEQEIEAMVQAVVPEIAGQIAAAAVSALLRGDEAGARAMQQRAAQLERSIEAEMKTRAAVLEARALTLCPHLAELDRIEAQLELRLANGEALDLLRL